MSVPLELDDAAGCQVSTSVSLTKPVHDFAMALYQLDHHELTVAVANALQPRRTATRR
jgi:hypothetical protein